MTRFRVTATLLVGAAVLAISLAGASPSQAQDYPGVPADLICRRTITSPDAMLPNATVTVTLRCLDRDGNGVDFIFKDGIFLRGSLNSTPVALEPPALVADHAVKYTIKLPADFELNAFHSATLTDRDTGKLKAIMRFYVDSKGKITAGPTTATTLARTGSSNHTGDLVKSGVVLLAFGGAAVRIARKRRQRTPAAV